MEEQSVSADNFVRFVAEYFLNGIVTVDNTSCFGLDDKNNVVYLVEYSREYLFSTLLTSKKWSPLFCKLFYFGRGFRQSVQTV
jgi:hypothetical protein